MAEPHPKLIEMFRALGVSDPAKARQLAGRIADQRPGEGPSGSQAARLLGNLVESVSPLGVKDPGRSVMSDPRFAGMTWNQLFEQSITVNGQPVNVGDAMIAGLNNRTATPVTGPDGKPLTGGVILRNWLIEGNDRFNQSRLLPPDVARETGVLGRNLGAPSWEEPRRTPPDRTRQRRPGEQEARLDGLLQGVALPKVALHHAGPDPDSQAIASGLPSDRFIS